MTQPALLTPSNYKEVFTGFGEELGTRPPLVPEFKFLNEVPLGEAFTLLLYGPTGSGKTRLLATAGDRALIINNGKGVETIQSPATQRLLKNPTPIVVRLSEKYGERGVFESAALHDALCDTIDYALEKFPERFDYVRIDDGTFMRKAAMNKGLELNQATNKSQTKKDIVDKYDVIAPAIQDYGMEMSILDSFFAAYTHILKGVGKHFIVCAHERLTFKKTEKIGEQPVLVKTAPAFTGIDKNPSMVSIYFDNVWYMEVVGSGDNRQFRVTTKGHEQLIANTTHDGIFSVTEIVKPDALFLQACVRRIRENIALPVRK